MAEQERDEEQIIVEISALITELLAVRHEPVRPFVTGWALSVHSESVEWDRERQSRSDYFWPKDQTPPMTVGLFTLAAKRQTGVDDDD